MVRPYNARTRSVGVFDDLTLELISAMSFFVSAKAVSVRFITSGVMPISFPVFSFSLYSPASCLNCWRIALTSLTVLVKIAEIFVRTSIKLDMFKLLANASAVSIAVLALNLVINRLTPELIASSFAPSNSAILILA